MDSRRVFFQRVASSLIVPLTFLPLAAVMLALGSQLGIGPVEQAGLVLIRTWLPLFYGIGVAVGFTDADGMAALTVAASYLTMVAVAEAVAGDPTLNVGVLGGILVGGVATWLFNRVKGVELPEFLALFAGKRMGPIVGAAAGLVMGYLFGWFWPPVQQGILTLGEWIYAAGGLGAFVYGAALRVLIPTGLHHILTQLVDTQLGGWIDPSTGRLVAGEYVRFLAGDPTAGRLLSGFFFTLGFGPLGAALAITHAARPELRRRVAGMMTTGALTAMVLGITEPVEFAFIFASPVLYGLHILLSGLASFLGYVLEIHLGGYALPMVLINWHRQQNGWLLFPVGLAYTLVYYVAFRAVIRWLRPPILGQTDLPATAADPTSAPGGGAAGSPAAGESGATEGMAIVAALGGAANIRDLTACMTRLRVELADPARVNESALVALGAAGIVRQGRGIQVVVGTRAGQLVRLVEGAIRSAATAGEAVVAAREVILLSPLAGRVIPIDQVPDPVFGGGMAGQGVALLPTGNRLCSPVAGRVVAIFPGGHALGIATDDGLELLIHVGLETAALKGEGFALTVSEGDQVEPGSPLGQVDLKRIEGHGRSLITPVLITNPDRLLALTPLASGDVQAGAPLLRALLRP